MTSGVGERRARALRAALGDPAAFGRILDRPLRPYQLAAARAILGSVAERRGLSISVMFARQAGKNELSAQVECLLLNRHQRVVGAQLVKAAPTFEPQTVNSLLRLERCLDNPLNRGRWRRERGYVVRLGAARTLFFSAGPAANVVGATANVLLECDEAQDVDPEKWTKEFLPMGATTNVTRAYYGTPWSEDTLLARIVAENREAERKDGVRRHFAAPWWVVAEHLPEYGRYVEAERERLGASHPLFRTQYALETIAGGGRLLSAGQLAQLRGDHPPETRRSDDATYVAGIDVAGESEVAADAALRSVQPRRDSTVVTIARVERRELAGIAEPYLRVVALYWWTGRDHRSQLAGLLDLLQNVWGVARVAVDGTGVGAGVASFLQAALGAEACEVVHFSAARKSELGYGLLAAVNAGRVKVYRGDADDEPLAELWRELEECRYEVRANQQLGFFVPEAAGHDDFVVSAALCVAAAGGSGVASAGATVHAKPAYSNERW